MVIYFLAVLYMLVFFMDAEADDIMQPVYAFLTAVMSVVIVSWAGGFWGNLKFYVLFIMLPVVILFDFLISSAIGLPPMSITVVAVIIYSIITATSQART